MTAEIIHDPAGKLSDIPLIFLAAVTVIHIRLDLEHIADQLFADSPDAELKRGISTEHIPHLERQIPFTASVEQLPVESQILSGGLVHVHRQIPLHAAESDRNKLIVRHLDHNRLNIRTIQHLIFRQPGQPLIRPEIASGELRGPGRPVVVHHADDLIQRGQAPQRDDLPRRMFMTHSDLSNPDLLHTHLFHFLSPLRKSGELLRRFSGSRTECPCRGPAARRWSCAARNPPPLSSFINPSA